MPTRAASGSPAGVSSSASASIDREPGPDRPLGLVLVRLRPAEIGEHAVAHVLGDVPAPALDHLGAGVLIGADHRAHVLGIEPRRQLGRAHQVAEQHRQLPPLGLGWARRWRRQAVGSQRFVLTGCERPAEGHDGPHEALTVTKRDAKLLEIVIGDLR